MRYTISCASPGCRITLPRVNSRIVERRAICCISDSPTPANASMCCKYQTLSNRRTALIAQCNASGDSVHSESGKGYLESSCRHRSDRDLLGLEEEEQEERAEYDMNEDRRRGACTGPQHHGPYRDPERENLHHEISRQNCDQALAVCPP